MIEQDAIQPGIRAARLCRDYTGEPRLGKKMPPEATLPFLRTWYNDRAGRNPARNPGCPAMPGLYRRATAWKENAARGDASFPARVV